MTIKKGCSTLAGFTRALMKKQFTSKEGIIMHISAVFKSASSLIVSIGAGAIVTNAVKATTPTGTNVYMKVAVGVGSLVVSNMVGDAASKYVSDNVDKLAADIKETKEKLDKNDEENEN